MSEPVERAKDTPSAVRMTFTRRAALASAAGALVSTGLSGLLMTARGDTRTAAPAWKPDDDFFGEPFVDQDEWREHPVRHRYAHGGFQGTDTASPLFPAAGALRRPLSARAAGRLRRQREHCTGPVSGVQCAVWRRAVPAMEHAFDCGGYLVESNQGHFGDDLAGAKGDAAIIAYPPAPSVRAMRACWRRRCTAHRRITAISMVAAAAASARSTASNACLICGTASCRW